MELKRIIDTYHRMLQQQVPMALATVIKVHGSSYRSPGARMLITTEGTWVGSISGGCLEGDALRKARTVIQGGKPEVVTYDTTEEINGMAFGLGCNGIIDVLLEPLSNSATNPIKWLEHFLENNQPGILGMVCASTDSEIHIGERIVFTPKGEILADTTTLKKQTLELLPECLESNISQVKQIDTSKGEIEVFFEIIEPPIRLLIFGGGFDVKPVTFFASQIGWKTIVTDECVAHTAPALFPDATLVSHCRKEYVLEKFEITPYTACILMSHNFVYDKEILKQLSSQHPRYVGVLGPKKRFDKMVDELRAEGTPVDQTFIDNVHAPIGLDLGAESAEEIAISIISEIKAHFNGRTGGFLKDRHAPIHIRTANQEILKPHHL